MISLTHPEQIAVELDSDEFDTLRRIACRPVEQQISLANVDCTNKIRFTILIVSFNTCELTRACLKSVLHWEPVAEIIVIDNASRDGSADMVEREFPDIRLLKLSQNIGFGRANTLAMQFAHHEVIVLLNSDTIIEDNALSRCAEFLMKDDSAGAVTPRLMGVDGIEQNTRHAVPTFRQTLQRSLWGRPMVSTGSDYWIPGTCMLLKRSAIEKAGGLFEPQLFMYWEDADLCARLRRSGYRLAVVDEAQITHYGGASGGGPNCSAKAGLHEWYTYGRHFWFARHRPGLESAGLWCLEFIDAFRCMGRSLVRPDRKSEWEFGKTLLKTLARRIFGLHPTFAISTAKLQSDDQLLINSPNQRPDNQVDIAVTDVGVVVIGRNEGDRLRKCLSSIAATGAPTIYVDSGSTDGSQQFARAIGAVVVELSLDSPFTAARARNNGLSVLQKLNPDIRYVQFVDGDCEMTDGWFTSAKQAIASDTRCAVVCGSLEERFPHASIYNRLCQLEWHRPTGRLDSCGGIFLARIDAMNSVDAFDSSLIAGEEPELCVRLRQSGWHIQGISAVMAKHDAAMSRFGQWWKRSVRAGHSYAQGYAMHGKSPERFRQREVRSILIWGLLAPLAAVALALPTYGLTLLILVAGYVRLWKNVSRSKVQQGESPSDASVYGWFVVLGKFAQVQGVLRFFANRLLGKTSRIIEYK